MRADGRIFFRQFAEMTQGQFVFLTYANGVSGAPGFRPTCTCPNFTVQNLDTLIVNLVAGEVANQTGQKTGKQSRSLCQWWRRWRLERMSQRYRLSGRGLRLCWTILWAAEGHFLGGDAAPMVAVVLSTRKRVIARLAPEQAPEIYIPESSMEQIAWPELNDQEGGEHTVLAAHLQPSANQVEVYLDVQPAQQPTVPLR